VEPYFQCFSPKGLAGDELDQLLALGFYRMHQSVFTVSHIEQGDLFRVHWLRYAVRAMEDRPTHRRIRSRVRNLTYTIEEAVTVPSAHQQLHARYRASIDFDGANSIDECLFGERKEGQSIYNTKCISVFDGDQLVAAGYFDLGDSAAASILHFFDPQYARYSLGKFLILLTIEYLNDQGYEYYYPGYVVEGLPKMDYKLFLGREQAEYFDPETVSWKKFDERILVRPPAADSLP
jgi:arginine-tRNA-protein transferase